MAWTVFIQLAITNVLSVRWSVCDHKSSDQHIIL